MGLEGGVVGGLIIFIGGGGSRGERERGCRVTDAEFVNIKMEREKHTHTHTRTRARVRTHTPPQQQKQRHKPKNKTQHRHRKWPITAQHTQEHDRLHLTALTELQGRGHALSQDLR